MRLFISVNFGEETLTRFGETQQLLRERGIGGNYSRRENLHLTLAFLGEVGPEKVPELLRLLQSLEVRPARLRFTRYGSFRSGGGSIVYLQGSREPRLEALQKELIFRLRQAGFAPDGKPFRPHITLLRQADALPDAGCRFEPIEAAYDRISLMLSERTDGRLRYTELGSSLPSQNNDR